MIFKEKFKTFKDVFDIFTENTLFRLTSKGYFSGIESPISIGKESNVFSALRADNTRVIIKIYRLSTCDFTKMHKYIQSDPRFSFVKKNKRAVVFAWAQREYRNLLKAREGNVRVPSPFVVYNNVLVMEFIGNENPAPKLKDETPKDLKKFFKEVCLQIKKLYECRIVHGDLSQHNILNFNEKPVFIDLSQGTVLENNMADEYLRRDIRIICSYFKKKDWKWMKRPFTNQ